MFENGVQERRAAAAVRKKAGGDLIVIDIEQVETAQIKSFSGNDATSTRVATHLR